MATYYVNNSGTEIYPFDTEAKGATSLIRMAKHFSGYNYQLLNATVGSGGYVHTYTNQNLPPFPIYSQTVDFNTIINQYNYDKYELLPGFWTPVPGGNFGPTTATFGPYHCITTSISTLPSNQYIDYTMEIKKNGLVVATFPKFTEGVNRTYTFRVSSTIIQIFIDGILYLTDVHGVSSWSSLFTLGGYNYSVEIYERVPVTPTVVTSMEATSSTLDYIVTMNQDTIYLNDTVTEPVILPGIYSWADVPYNFSYGQSTLTSETDKQNWIVGNNNYNSLNLVSLNIDGALLSSYVTNNPTLVTDCTFTNSRAIAYISDTSVGPSEISNNIFDTGSSYAIYIDNPEFSVRIFNNVFKDRSGYSAIYIGYDDTTPVDIIIVNNTFYGCSNYMLSGYVEDDSGALITNLMLFNNVDNSVDGIELYLILIIPGNLGKFIHDHNNSSNYYYEVNSVEELPTVTETSVDPLFTGTLPVPYELQDGSPCIGVGITRSETPPYDLNGVLRGDPPDLGALDKGATLVADFIGSPLSGTVNLIVVFTDLSMGNPTSWNWDFGDGSPPSFVQNPTHVYTSIGIFTVTLIATKGLFSSTETKLGYIIVTPPPLPGTNIGGGFTRTRGPTLIFD